MRKIPKRTDVIAAAPAPRSKMGMGTLEVVIIIAALLTLALFFSSEIKTYAGSLADKVFDNDALSELDQGVPTAAGAIVWRLN